MWSVRKVGEFGFDFASSAVAGVDDLEFAEAIESSLIVSEAIELLPWFAFPRKAKPMKVGENGLVVFRSHAGVIDVFKPD